MAEAVIERVVSEVQAGLGEEGVDAADRFLRAKVHDDALGRRPDRRLEYLNVRYTAGPKAQLDALPENWKYAAVTVVVGA